MLCEKADALLVVQERLREMPLVGVRQGNTGAEMADGRWLARDQNKGFNAHKERSPTQEALRDELLRACLPAVRGGLKRCHALTAKSGMSVAIRHARNTQSLRETFQSKKKQKESRKSFKI